MIHIGKTIEKKLHDQRRSATWLATKLGCTRVNIYEIFQRESLETNLLLSISEAFEHNFFEDLVKSFNSQNKSKTKSGQSDKA